MGVSALDVDPHGSVYVGDRSGQLLVFSPDGSVLRKLGRKGRGPGEFEQIQSVRVLPGDSIYVFDASLDRATVFAPGSDRPSYSVNLGSSSMLFPYWTGPLPSRGRIFAAYRAGFNDDDWNGKPRNRKEVLRILNADGSLQMDSVLASNETEALVFRGQFNGVTYNPFGRGTVYAIGGDDHLYTAWTGALEIGVYSPDGRRVRTIRPAITPAPRPITGRDRDSVVSALANNIPAAQVRRAFAEIGSDSWPLFRELVVDDARNVWLGLLGKHGEPVHWTAFNQAGAQVASMDLPENVSLRVVRGSRAYGIELDQDDVPRVVIYELKAAATPTAPARPS
jgi:hypothetical protein